MRKRMNEDVAHSSFFAILSISGDLLTGIPLTELAYM